MGAQSKEASETISVGTSILLQGQAMVKVPAGLTDMVNPPNVMEQPCGDYHWPN